MIVPRSRLLVWVALAVVPLMGLAGAEPSAAPAAAVPLAGFLAVVLFDAARARRGLARLRIELAPLTRLSQDREGAIDIRIVNERRKTRRIRLGLPLPDAIHSRSAELLADLPADGPVSRLAWPCRPLRRGRFKLRRVFLEVSSPAGFWAFRSSVPVEAELRVYPNLFRERRDVAAILLRRGLPGMHAQRQIGKGREFEKLREYISGDSFEDIHWKATAKRGHPMTKVFQIERTQDIYVVLDASRLSARTAGGSALADPLDPSAPEEGPIPALERSVTAALVLALAAEQQGDFFGLVTFSDRVLGFLRAGSGRSHFNSCRDVLYALEPQPVSPDYDELCAFLRHRVRRRALLIFLTDLDDPLLAETFVRTVEHLRGQHVILVAMRKPEQAAPLFSDSHAYTLDDLYRKLAGHLSWQNLRELEVSLRRRGADLALLEDARMSAGLVSRYLRIKRRQLL